VVDFTQASSSFTSDYGLDKAILSALFPKSILSSSTDPNEIIVKRKAQMRLALAWNRVDYARDNILNPTNADYKTVSDFYAVSDYGLSVTFRLVVALLDLNNHIKIS